MQSKFRSLIEVVNNILFQESRQEFSTPEADEENEARVDGDSEISEWFVRGTREDPGQC